MSLNGNSYLSAVAKQFDTKRCTLNNIIESEFIGRGKGMHKRCAGRDDRQAEKIHRRQKRRLKKKKKKKKKKGRKKHAL
ncbi:unnamed protein product [Lasius platythorax]|uniref:Uncharacterized protein n=1 Tax=Lasius platythorax TaxID=488582 RepID=A0AAV2P0Y7_9HYME